MIGDDIRTIRARRRISQDELAVKAGLSQFHITSFETGRMNPRPEELARIRKALDWTETDDRALALLAGEPASCQE